MTKEKLKPIDVSKYTVTESGNVIKYIRDKLKQEAEEYALEKCKECYMCNSEENGERGYCPKLESRKEGYLAGAEPREKRIAELEDKLANADYQLEGRDNEIRELKEQIEKMKKYGKLLQDICTVMGNDVYMVSVGLENRVKVLWDSSEEKEGLKMVEDIENRLLKIKPQEWAEITKWEIKEK